MYDVESHEQRWINTSDKNIRARYSHNYVERIQNLQSVFVKSGVDAVHIQSDEDYVRPLMNLFKRR